jgi:hypothetical protein
MCAQGFHQNFQGQALWTDLVFTSRDQLPEVFYSGLSCDCLGVCTKRCSCGRFP